MGEGIGGVLVGAVDCVVKGGCFEDLSWCGIGRGLGYARMECANFDRSV